jgi:uncharacterized protein YggT (Ycf19 family)
LVRFFLAFLVLTFGGNPQNMAVMYFSTWDLLLNVVTMLFWFRLWMPEDRDLYFNPHLSSLWRFSEAVVSSLRSVFFRTPARLIALIALLFLLVFRGITFYGLAMRAENAAWLLRLGFERNLLYPGNTGVFTFVAFSFLSFAAFLFTFWGVSLLYASQRSSTFNHASETLYHVSRPFSLVRMEFRPLVLLAFGLLLAFLVNLDVTARNVPSMADDLTLRTFARYLLSALRGWADVLNAVQMFLIVLIIGSWAAMFSTSSALMFFCKDWIDLLLGPLRRFPLRIGILDLTPILFFFVVKYLYLFLCAILAYSYERLP